MLVDRRYIIRSQVYTVYLGVIFYTTEKKTLYVERIYLILANSHKIVQRSGYLFHRVIS